MTYEQAIDLLFQTYPNPFAISSADRLNTLTSAGVDREMADYINRLQSNTTYYLTDSGRLVYTYPGLTNPYTGMMEKANPSSRYIGTAATSTQDGSNYTGITETTPTTSGSGYTAPVIPMGGATEDQINYLSNLRRLATQDRMARIQSQQQRSEVATQYEPQIRKAGREIYNQQVKAQASLGARGISGAPGLSVAARRAAMAAPATQRTSLISERDRQLAALERTLTSQLSAYEEEIRRNQEQLTRATTLANQLTGTGQ